MFTGGFGPFEATQLSEALRNILAGTGRILVTAQLRDVQFRTGQYYAIAEAQVRQSGGLEHPTFFGITTAGVPPAARGHFATINDRQVFFWQHPADPLLPGLSLAATPAKVQQHFVPERDLTALQTIIYRPLNRAVFQAHLAPAHPGEAGDTIFMKVLRPGQAQPVYATHRLLAAAGFPAVAPIAPPVADVLALAAGRGMPLGDYTRSEGVHNRFDPRQLLELLDRIPAEVLQRPQQSSWADRHPEFIAAARAAMPRARGRVARLGARLEVAHAHLDLGPIVPTHGDLYEAHILVDPITGRVQHILDVDGVGPGYRVDDLACLIGHLAVLGVEDEQPWGWAAALRMFQMLASETNPVVLAVRSAAVVVSLIPPYQPDTKSQLRGERYLRIAEDLLELA